MSDPALDRLQEVLGYDLPSMDNALSKALIDAEYRQRLLTEPKDALADEGVQIPDGVSVTFHEISLTDRHIFLPPLVRDPEPVPAEELPASATNRPPDVPNDGPVRGAVRPGVARPFMLGANYPAPPPDADQPDPRW